MIHTRSHIALEEKMMLGCSGWLLTCFPTWTHKYFYISKYITVEIDIHAVAINTCNHRAQDHTRMCQNISSKCVKNAKQLADKFAISFPIVPNKCIDA